MVVSVLLLVKGHIEVITSEAVPGLTKIGAVTRHEMARARTRILVANWSLS